jgi:AraC-like DNA-binding protein/quercetin dioxygenase-like cupin family protein
MMAFPGTTENLWAGWESLTPVLRYGNFYDAKPGGGFGPRYISDFQILYVQLGDGSAIVDGSHFELRAGDIVFYGPNQRHEVTSSHHSPLKLLGLHFLFRHQDLFFPQVTSNSYGNSQPYDFGDELPACPLIPTPSPWLRPHSPGLMQTRVEALVLSHVSSPNSRLLEKRGLLLLMMESWYDAVVDRSPRLNCHPAVEFARNEIARNVMARLTTDSLSEQTKLSADHFGRLFKQQTGFTVREYVANQRLLEARRLLIEGKDNVSEIALAVGYDDPFYFSRQFRKAFGVAPSRFREHYSLQCPPP